MMGKKLWESLSLVGLASDFGADKVFTGLDLASRKRLKTGSKRVNVGPMQPL